MLYQLVVLFAFVAAHDQNCKPKKLACDELIKICQLSGFVPNMEPKGFDLYADCINPMMQNKSTPLHAIYELPIYPAEYPGLCKLVRPNFGNGTVGSQGGSCSIIRKSCLVQGFVPGSTHGGNQLFRNCINPIMQHKSHEAEAIFPLPVVTENQITRCKQENPIYGDGPVGTPGDGHPSCYEIKKACIHKGFEEGKSHCGYSIWENCVNPIIQGLTAHADNILPLPTVDSDLIAKCKADVPLFGSGSVGSPVSPTCSSCQAIKQECIDDGFQEGKSHEGFDLWTQCINPNMQQTNPEHLASKDIPCIDLELIAKCRRENPHFGI